ncbi:MAG: DUF3516 domain-containing protein, partial [Ornithinibacter sp.]
LDQWEGQQAALRTLLLDNHEEPARREALVERAVQVMGSLLRAGVIEPDDGSSVDDWAPPEAPPVRHIPADRTGSGDRATAVDQSPSVDGAPDGVGGGLGALGDMDGGLGALGEALAAAGLTATPPPLRLSGSSDTPSESRETDTSTDEVGENGEGPDAVEPGPLERFVRGEGRSYPEGPFQVALDLHDGFALNQPLSAFALAALDLFAPENPGYALDVVSLIEATLDDPRPVLMAQRFEARGEAVGAMKADGMDYEDRMDALDDVTWPMPLAEELEGALRVYRQRHPWVDPRGLSPKSVVRELYERAMTFGEFVAHHKLARAEGVFLRYLTDAYRALRSTVPMSARTEELDDIVEWLGELVRHTDSSLLDEWESLTHPTGEGVSEVRVPTENRALSANPRALRVMLRQAMFRRAELLALGRYATLATLDDGLTSQEWADAAEGYFTEYDAIGTGPEARGPAFFSVSDDGDGVWVATQILEDPDGDRDWRITAELDIAATDEARELVLVTTGLGPT